MCKVKEVNKGLTSQEQVVGKGWENGQYDIRGFLLVQSMVQRKRLKTLSS